VKLLPLALAAIAMAGCASFFSATDDEDDLRVPFICSPEATRLPCTSAAEQGVSYDFNLLTHCGVEWAYFDGHYWVPRPRIDPPSHWASIESGTMVLESQDAAVFEADEGGGARFAPARPSFRPETCA
jgi:hypothetical protein